MNSITLYESPETTIEKFRLNGVLVVKKVIKWKFAKLLCTHEVNVLRRLQWLEWVQQLVTQDSSTSFISTFIEGNTLLTEPNLPNDYFEKLTIILKRIHDKWVADPDFAHSVDLLVDKEGNPHVIDLASAIIYNKKWFIIPLIIFPIFSYIKELNYKYIAKRKARFLPNQLTEHEKSLIQHMWLTPNLARLWRRLWRIIKNQ